MTRADGQLFKIRLETKRLFRLDSFWRVSAYSVFIEAGFFCVYHTDFSEYRLSVPSMEMRRSRIPI